MAEKPTSERVEVYFYLRDAKATTTNTPIFSYISLGDNERFKYPTAIPAEKINPTFWNKDLQRAKTTRKEIPDKTIKLKDLENLNRRLDSLKESITIEVEKFFNHHKRQPTQTELTEILDKELGRKQSSTTVEKPLDVVAFMEKHIKDLTGRIYTQTGKPYSHGTIMSYKNTLNIIRRFMKEVRKYRKLDFNDITLAFYFDFTDYLTKELKFSTNTVGRHIKTLKTILGEATELGLNNQIEFKHKKFKKLTEDTEAIYLTTDELTALFNFDLSQNERLERVRDLLIVGCWTGLRFSDFTNIQKNNFFVEDDERFIEIETQKTGSTVVIPVHPMVEAIMQRYEGKTPNSLPPPISNQKLNEYLKELGRLVGITEESTMSQTKGGLKITRTQPKYELMTTHVCRRSFATNQYLMGVPTADIMAITGHKTESIFFHYIKIKPRDSANRMRSIWKQQTQLRKVV